MDYFEIFTSCRIGDLDRVKYLVEKRDVELNIRDKWDTTPLYYACLCGHQAVVQYLLDNGAKCEANTFDGERCLYAALNDKIKHTLKNYKMITSRTMKRDKHDEFLRKMLQTSNFQDMHFKVEGTYIAAHRCVIAVRCPSMHAKIEEKLNGRAIVSIAQVNRGVFQLILEYIYTGKMQVNLVDVPVAVMLAKQCGLDYLVHSLEDKYTEKDSFEGSKIGVRVKIFSVESETDKAKLSQDLSLLADEAVAGALQENLPLPFPPKEIATYPDVAFYVGSERFLCHKAFFACRSDYFKAMFEDHFCENTADMEMMSLHLHDLDRNMFLCIAYYIYTGLCELHAATVYDVLFQADMYLLPGLKKLCANLICKMIDDENVFSILRTARMFDLPKLEDQCAAYMADNICEIITEEQFAELIMEDVNSLKQRQETDSIDIIDNIRYHLTSHVQSYSEIEEANAGLTLIDNLLIKLDLDC